MTISQKDLEFMQHVAEAFRKTRTESASDGSVQAAAKAAGLSRTKAVKILVTMGEMETPHTAAMELRSRGKSIGEIARILGVSTATVSIALPYEDRIGNSLAPSEHAMDVRGYRAFERRRKDRMQAGRQDRNTASRASAAKGGVSMRDSTETDLKGGALRGEAAVMAESSDRSLRPQGALRNRDPEILRAYVPGGKRPKRRDVMRLHLELCSECCSKETIEKIVRYGKVRYGACVSRDVVIPRDLPLFALHYLIQRAFGWQNSHLRQFYLPQKRLARLAGARLEQWASLVGRVFRSPLMDENAEFWNDDYVRGSFKFWLRRKYTGPYLSGNWGEEIEACVRDMARLDMEEPQYVLYGRRFDEWNKRYDEEEHVLKTLPVFDWKGNRNPPPKPWRESTKYRVETVRLGDLPTEALSWHFERYPFALLERLPVGSVLISGANALPQACSGAEREVLEKKIEVSCEELCARPDLRDRLAGGAMNRWELLAEEYVSPFTDELLYEYDFGDSWEIRITASDNCPDLVTEGRITQKELDQANVKCRQMHRPVLLARDGEMLVDDLGAMTGFGNFLEAVYRDIDAMPRQDQGEARAERRRLLIWAKSLGWHWDEATNYNLL